MYVYISLCFQAKKDMHIFNAVKENLFDTYINSILLKRKAPVKKQVYCVILFYTSNEKFEICNVGSPIGMVVPIFIINIFFNWDSTKVIPIEKTQAGYISMISQEFKRGSKCRSNSPAYLFLQLIQQFQVATRRTNPCMVVWQIYRDTEQPQKKETSMQPSLQFYDKINGSFIDQYLILSTFFEVIFHKVWFLSNM